MLRKLDLGTGNKKPKGFITLDIRKETKPDIVCDLEKDKIPFDDNSVDFIRASHILEHIRNFFYMMNECYRILTPKGLMEVTVPYYSSFLAIQDPTHIRLFHERSFSKLYLSKQISSLRHYGIECEFRIQDIHYKWNNDWVNKSDEEKQFAKNHYINVVDEMIVLLGVVK